jgi:hypothetical protein
MKQKEIVEKIFYSYFIAFKEVETQKQLWKKQLSEKHIPDKICSYANVRQKLASEKMFE